MQQITKMKSRKIKRIRAALPSEINISGLLVLKTSVSSRGDDPDAPILI